RPLAPRPALPGLLLRPLPLLCPPPPAAHDADLFPRAPAREAQPPPPLLAATGGATLPQLVRAWGGAAGGMCRAAPRRAGPRLRLLTPAPVDVEASGNGRERRADHPWQIAATAAARSGSGPPVLQLLVRLEPSPVWEAARDDENSPASVQSAWWEGEGEGDGELIARFPHGVGDSETALCCAEAGHPRRCRGESRTAHALMPDRSLVETPPPRPQMSLYSASPLPAKYPYLPLPSLVQGATRDTKHTGIRITMVRQPPLPHMKNDPVGS
ncbi:hypothetical protein JHW43_007094, partial [Diplocarpon mali]